MLQQLPEGIIQVSVKTNKNIDFLKSEMERILLELMQILAEMEEQGKIAAEEAAAVSLPKPAIVVGELQ